MDRLFLRVYLRLFVAIAGAGLLAVFVVGPRVEQQVRRNIEQALSPPTALMAELLAGELAARSATTAELTPALRRGAARFGVTVELARFTELPMLDASVRARLEKGEVVSLGEFPRTVVCARIGATDQLMRIGPINAVHPFGQGRGWAVLVLLLLGLSFGAYLLVVPIKRRLDALARATDELGRGRLEVRADARGGDAISHLAETFNVMAARIQSLIAAQQELLRTVSHELRTPLQRAHFALEDVQDHAGDGAGGRATQRMEAALDEIESLIAELLAYVRLKDHAMKPEPVDAAQLARETCAEFAELRGTIALECRLDPADSRPTGQLEKRLVQRALSNLVSNALRYAKSRVELGVEKTGDAVRFMVDDDGPGVPETERAEIFEPFRRIPRGEKDREGYGLGLAIVRRVAEAHGGSATVEASPLGGARFALLFPLRREL